MKIHFDKLQEKAKNRPEGYLLEVLAAGVAEGEYLRITNFPAYYQLCKKYGTGIGTAVAKVAQPIAGAIDAVAKTKLKNCLPCKKREAKLNGI